MRKRFYMQFSISTEYALREWVEKNPFDAQHLEFPSYHMAMANYVRKRANLHDCTIVPQMVNKQYLFVRVYAQQNPGDLKIFNFTMEQVFQPEERNAANQSNKLLNAIERISRFILWPSKFMTDLLNKMLFNRR